MHPDAIGLDRTALALLETLALRPVGSRVSYTDVEHELRCVWGVPIRLAAFGLLSKRGMIECSVIGARETAYSVTAHGRIVADTL
jgi:hypothetical protein